MPTPTQRPLIDRLPPRKSDLYGCPACFGTGRIVVGERPQMNDRDQPPDPVFAACRQCDRGYIRIVYCDACKLACGETDQHDSLALLRITAVCECSPVPTEEEVPMVIVSHSPADESERPFRALRPMPAPPSDAETLSTLLHTASGIARVMRRLRHDERVALAVKLRPLLAGASAANERIAGPETAEQRTERGLDVLAGGVGSVSVEG